MDINNFWNLFFPRRLRFDSQQKKSGNNPADIFSVSKKSSPSSYAMYSIARIDDEGWDIFNKSDKPSPSSHAMYAIARLDDDGWNIFPKNKKQPPSSNAMYSIADFG